MCVYLPDFTHVIINLFVFACVKILVNKSVHSSWGHTEIPGGECHRHENRFWKRDDEIPNFRNKRLFGMWMPAGVQMNHGSSSAHVQWFSHQNGGADICDIT